MRPFARRLPLIVFVLHTLLVMGSAWIALRSANDPLAQVFFLPVMFIDMPVSLLSMPLAPVLDTVSAWLAPTLGKGEASIVVLAGWLGITGPCQWMFIAWWIGQNLDRRRARATAPAPGAEGDSDSAAAPPTTFPGRAA